MCTHLTIKKRFCADTKDEFILIQAAHVLGRFYLFPVLRKARTTYQLRCEIFHLS